MFIIAGITPKIKVLDANPRVCPVCGLARAYLKRADSYLSLFFIPLFRLKTGEPFVICDRCETLVSGGDDPLHTWKDPGKSRCKNCGKTIDQGFAYCPYCGKPI